MIVAVALLAVAAQEPAQRPVVLVEPDRIELQVDATRSLRALVAAAGGRAARASDVRWVSLDTTIVRVAADGRITAVRPGTTRIGAIVQGASGFAVVTVPALPPATVEATLPVSELPAGTSAPLEVTVRDRLGLALAGAGIDVTSADPVIATGDATGRIFAIAPGRTTIRVAAGAAATELEVHVVANPAQDYRVVADRVNARTGDVVRLQAMALLPDGREQAALRPAWLIEGGGAMIEDEQGTGVFVAERPGRYRVTAVIGRDIVRDVLIDVEPRTYQGHLEVVGHGLTAGHHAGDTWAFEGVDGRDYAYIGTFMHDWMKAWDITDPANPVLTDSVQVDARRINDVKIHPNNRLAVITREGASNRRNGIVLLDLSQPAHPRILSEYTETVTGGVHNVWIRGDLDLVYACHNGTSELHIIDISDPASPREVGRWGLEKTGKTLHDVIVQDGYAYLSYWDDGVVILDAGAGTHGGTSTSPVFVSSLSYPEGNTHVAWRHGRYLFVGDEIFPDDWDPSRPIEARGFIHVLDVTDIDSPREVAKYEVPEAGVHNVWVEDDILYVGYYQGGLRMVDVSGELRGDLYWQGREMGAVRTSSPDAVVPNWSMTWGAQVFKGHIITADLFSGLWTARWAPGRPVS